MIALPSARGTLIAFVACLILLASRAAADERQVLNFDPDWKFLRDDPANASKPDFDDREWSNASTPHTFNDVDTFDNWSTPGHRGEQIQWSGRTWYRKTFTLPEAMKGKKVFIEFEGVRQIAEVYLNGQKLGVSKTGFTPFGFELTPELKFGAANVLAVMVDNRFMKDALDPEAVAALGAAANKAGGKTVRDSNIGELAAKANAAIPEEIDQLEADQIPWNNPHWHPAHGGIFRNVKVTVTDPLHISLPLYSFLETEGPYVFATQITEKAAQITLEVPLQNQRASNETVEVEAELLDANGKSALTLKQKGELAAGAKTTLKLSGSLANPRLWEPAYPHCYDVKITLRAGRQVVDTASVPLGIREVRWDAQQGFFINGEHLKLHGWGQKPTNEWPGLGAALPDWLQFFTLKMMHDAGGNFLRWGHSAAGPAQINAGDRLGLITDQPGVDGEADTLRAAWKLRANAFRDVLIYYRNNPSILIWEGGNQKVTRAHAEELRGLKDKYDPHGNRAYAHRRADQITAEFMDVGIGTEGGREIAALPVVEGEYDREESPRRVWDGSSPPNFGYPEAKGQTYQLTSEDFAVHEVEQYVKKLGAPDHSGGANWIFSDSTSGGRVAVEVARAGGEVDGVRLAKEAYYACAAMFRAEPRVHVIGHWTYPEGTKKTVFVVSNADDVELFVNARSLGHGVRSNHYLFTFPDVIWEAGEIKAIASSKGQAVASQSKRTAGFPVALKLTPVLSPDGWRADGSDIALVDVEAVDANGERCPTVQQRVDFDALGPVVWRGGYNSGKVDSINHTYLDLEAGINRIALRSTRTAGTVTLKATSEGLKASVLTLKPRSYNAKNGYSTVFPATSTVELPEKAPVHPNLGREPMAPSTTRPVVAGEKLDSLIKALSYSGPAGNQVHVENGAHEGKNAYVDLASPFPKLPPELEGADWIQAATKDSTYSAVDLIQLAVNRDSVVSVLQSTMVATPPAWLTAQFQRTAQSLTLSGQTMQIFQRHLKKDESLTLGSNNDGADAPGANMYLVLVQAETRK